MKIGIVGCGFAGLSTALTLQNHDVTLFESAAKILPVGAGVLLQPLGMEILARFGVTSAVLRAGDQIQSLVGSNEKDKKILDLHYRDGRFGIGIHRAVLFDMLYRRLSKEITIKLNTTVAGIDLGGKQAVLETATGESEKFDIVIISNGARSRFRRHLAGFQYAKEYPWGALWGILPNSAFDQSVLWQKYRGTKILLGVLPCGRALESDEKIFSFFWSLRKTDYQQLIEAGFDAFREQVAQTSPIFDQILTGLSFEDFIYTTYHDVYCSRWHRENAIFLGDAIHGMSPQLGIGLNMALLDGYLLGMALNAPNFARDKLKKLRTMRKWQVIYYHVMSQIVTRFFQSDYQFLGAIRDVVFPVARKMGYIDTLMENSLTGRQINFCKSMSPDLFVHQLVAELT